MHAQDRRRALFIPFLALLVLSLAACNVTTATIEPQPTPTEAAVPPTVAPEQEEETPLDDPLLAFETLLARAVQARDFEALRPLMADPFAIAGWRSEGQEVPRDAAVEQLRRNHLSSGATIHFQEPPDLSQQLGVRDILAIWDPAVNPVSALFSIGWSADGAGQAFLIIAQRPDGTFTWDGVLIAPAGFAEGADGQPEPHPVLETDVQFVQVSAFLDEIPMRGGPGDAYAQIGFVAGGMAAMVTGVSADGAWWRVVCPDDTVGDCWISADPQQTGPVAPSDMPSATDPVIAISPVSGPAGTLVQVVASGFPPLTSVTVWVGPQNSEFSEAARGKTDEDGTFSVVVQAQGGPGTNLIFGAGLEGQAGVLAPDMFRITDVGAD